MRYIDRVRTRVRGRDHGRSPPITRDTHRYYIKIFVITVAKLVLNASIHVQYVPLPMPVCFRATLNDNDSVRPEGTQVCAV